MFSSSPLDWALVALYFGFLAAVWSRLLGARLTALEYLVAGRRVTLPAFVATLVATWYGGILGVGEYSYRYGVSNWLVFGVPYYLGALGFALLFARRARQAALYTIPDLLERNYGRPAALMGALAVFVTSAPAAYVLMLGTLFAAMFQLPLVPCIVAAALFSVFYIDRGGLRTVVFTDQVQFVLMYLGFILMLVFLVARHGGPAFLHQHLPSSHFTWHGGNPPAAILVWYFIALGTLVDPGFWQRAYAARDPRVAKHGVLWSIAFWFLFDFLTTTCGLYARALLPALRDPVFAFPELARITLPPVALGLFYLGMIATVMSTIDSYGFVAATTIGRDVIWRLRGETGEQRLPFYSRLGLWISAAFATALAVKRQSVIELWHDLGSITTPTLLLPVGLGLLGRGRLGPRWTLAAMIVPFAVTLAWIVAKNAGEPAPGRYPWSIEPIYAGLATSLLVYALGWSQRTLGAAFVGSALHVTPEKPQ
jgi:SSS family solute:Na+ symporter